VITPYEKNIERFERKAINPSKRIVAVYATMKIRLPR